MSKSRLYSILTIFSALVGLIVALILYIPFNPSYRPWSNYISHMGDGPLAVKIALGCMLGFTALFSALLWISNSKKIKKFGAQTAFLFIALFAQIALLFLGIFPFDPAMPTSLEIHRIGAVFYFAFSGIVCIMYSILDMEENKIASIFLVIGGICGIFFAVGLFLQEYGFIPHNMIVYLVEWAYFLFMMGWLLLIIFPLKKK